ncbi:MAG: F0F1 ATP synthase subunit gamma [Magnetococcales bacterium]|nr:F0F1 ATP synthase subunit gamma [Magnetococcales bacterium]
MPNLKVLRKRIRSVKNTQQITKAMKMVAAAKLRRSQERAHATRPYSERMSRLMQSLTAVVGDGDNAPKLMAGHGREPKKIELVLFSADRGLCGSFNSSVMRAARARIGELEKQGFKVTLTCVGRKANEVMRRYHRDKIRKTYTGLSRALTFKLVEEGLSRELLEAYEAEKFDVCYMVFNTFKSAMSQELTWRQLMPIPIPEQDGGGGEGEYLYEPNEEELLAQLLPRNVAMQLFQALVESDASEHGARMTAMDNAVRNAAEMIRKLTITFNRTRQAAITTELMEIIGGAESLKG